MDHDEQIFMTCNVDHRGSSTGLNHSSLSKAINKALKRYESQIRQELLGSFRHGHVGRQRVSKSRAFLAGMETGTDGRRVLLLTLALLISNTTLSTIVSRYILYSGIFSADLLYRHLHIDVKEKGVDDPSQLTRLTILKLITAYITPDETAVAERIYRYLAGVRGDYSDIIIYFI